MSRIAYNLAVARTLLRGAASRMVSLAGKGVQKPVILELMVTSACDCRCLMCNIWKKGGRGDLSLEEIRGMLKDPVLSDLRSVTLTGGEPFQRDDILDVCRAIHDSSRNLVQLYLSTNGFDHQAIARKVRRILEIMSRLRRLRIAVSFDHISQDHDRIRGKRGIHSRALELVRTLKGLNDPRLTVQGNFTIAPYNVHELPKLHEYFKAIGLRMFWFPIMVSGSYYENEDKAERLAFDAHERLLLRSFVRFLLGQQHSMPDYYYYSGLLASIRRGERAFPCAGGSRFLMVDSHGEVHPCYLLPPQYRMGSIRERPLEDIWHAESSSWVRRQICNNPTCDRCIQWYDGYALSHSLKALSRLIMARPLKAMKQLLGI